MKYNSKETGLNRASTQGKENPSKDGKQRRNGTQIPDGNEDCKNGKAASGRRKGEHSIEIDPEEIMEAVKILEDGGIILYPTDTVWGIGCDATNEEAVARVFELKQRQDSKSLITLVSDADMIGRYVKVIPEMAINLIEVNDKPMTIIYPGAINLAPNVMAEDGTVGIRIPQSEFCLSLIRKFRKPLVSTSANISGEETPTCYEEIPIDIIEAADWVADPYYGRGATGCPSQIIKVDVNGEVKIIRE